MVEKKDDHLFDGHFSIFTGEQTRALFILAVGFQHVGFFGLYGAAGKG